jgi:hypothetical protein
MDRPYRLRLALDVPGSEPVVLPVPVVARRKLSSEKYLTVADLVEPVYIDQKTAHKSRKHDRASKIRQQTREA